VLVAFICNHCPFVVHVADALAVFGSDYQARGLSIVAISSNDVAAYPQDGPDQMAAFAMQKGFTFPYLYDETQQVAQAYQAACTPDFFLFDTAGKLAYRGQFDSSRPNQGTATGEDLRAAADAVLAGRAPAAEQKPSMGCSIKWKAGVM
jgi:thiol-disulfide isomerase/thioredoxin